jgi:hypothetical protein
MPEARNLVSGPVWVGLGLWRLVVLRGRLFRPASPGLGLAALQVRPEGGGKARPLLVFCICVAVQGKDSAPGFNARIAAKSGRIDSPIARFGQA